MVMRKVCDMYHNTQMPLFSNIQVSLYKMHPGRQAEITTSRIFVNVIVFSLSEERLHKVQ